MVRFTSQLLCLVAIAKRFLGKIVGIFACTTAVYGELFCEKTIKRRSKLTSIFWLQETEREAPLLPIFLVPLSTSEERARRV